MSGLSVIIPSRSIDNLVPCIEAVRKHEPDISIIVVDDFAGDGLNLRKGVGTSVLKASGGDLFHLQIVPDIRPPEKLPFIFARNCNIGIQAAGSDDVILLNDDALLETAGGFTSMQQAAALFPQFGLVSATTNVAGNPEQWRRPLIPGGPLRRCPKTPGNSFPTVAFVCVLIPRSTIMTVGLLDERFGGTTPEGKRIYGWDDTDYCRRVHKAGLHIGICDGCYVNHANLTSTFRSAPFDMEAGKQIYLSKWGTM